MEQVKNQKYLIFGNEGSVVLQGLISYFSSKQNLVGVPTTKLMEVLIASPLEYGTYVCVATVA